MTRALVLDFDGTLVPTEQLIYEAWRDLFAARGHELPIETWTRCIGHEGVGYDPRVHAISLGFGEPEIIDAEARRRLAKGLAALEPASGAAALLDRAERAGVALGIASGSSGAWVLPLLDRFGWRGRFRTVRTRDHGPTKPSPALYAMALEDLAADPAASWAVEDSGPGVLAAKAAGMRVVAVPHGLTVTHDLSAAELVVDSLAGVPIDRMFP